MNARNAWLPAVALSVLMLDRPRTDDHRSDDRRSGAHRLDLPDPLIHDAALDELLGDLPSEDYILLHLATREDFTLAQLGRIVDTPPDQVTGDLMRVEAAMQDAAAGRSDWTGDPLEVFARQARVRPPCRGIGIAP